MAFAGFADLADLEVAFAAILRFLGLVDGLGGSSAGQNTAAQKLSIENQCANKEKTPNFSEDDTLSDRFATLFAHFIELGGGLAGKCPHASLRNVMGGPREWRFRCLRLQT
jgi:hypothetical protein